MKPNLPPKKIRCLPDEEKQKYVALSFDECSGLTERSVRCPYCNFIVANVMSDAAGHLRVKCQFCKAETLLNLAYFRRLRWYERYKHRIERNSEN